MSGTVSQEKTSTDFVLDYVEYRAKRDSRGTGLDKEYLRFEMRESASFAFRMSLL